MSRLPSKKKFLKRSIIRVVKTGQVVSASVADRVTVNDVPTVGLYDVRPLDVTQSDNNYDVVEIRRERSFDDDSADLFIKKPGNVVLLSDLTVPPGVDVIKLFLFVADCPGAK